MTYTEGETLCKSLNTKMLYLKNEAENWDCDIFSKKDDRCVKRLKNGFMTTTNCNQRLTVLCDLY
ncbi:hypothetical protein TSMEX_004743 [Taenia solium]|eukprot:TsM_000844300 transcript=TsM_000844300 gene=TsM_000844300